MERSSQYADDLSTLILMKAIRTENDTHGASIMATSHQRDLKKLIYTWERQISKKL